MQASRDARLILIRPGTTDFEQQGRIMGTLDIPLNEDGRAEIEGIGRRLHEENVQIIYHSPGQAAEESARVLAEILDAKTKTNGSVRNLDLGLWQGKLIDEVKRTQRKVYRLWQEQPESVCPPEGETLAAVQKRVETFVNRLRRKHKTGSVALVAPEPYASILRAHLLQEEVGDLWRSESQCAQWESLALTPPGKLVGVGQNE